MKKMGLIVLLFFGLIVAGSYFSKNIFSYNANNAEKAARPQAVLASLGAKATSTPAATKPSGRSAGPLLSFNFDDGLESSYEIALPIFNKAGFKTTQYIITGAFAKQGYVTKDQVLEMQAEGHEIGAHTRTHPHLNQIPLEQAKTEIEGSKQDLLAMGVKSVTTFAYPYGDSNPQAEQLVKDAGFAGARITQPEYDDSSVDRFALKRQRVEAGTSFAEVKKAIDEAIKEKKWIILVFHGTDSFSYEDVPHQLIQQIVDYVQQVKIPVVTNAEGLKLIDKIP